MHVYEFNRALTRAPSPSVVKGLRAVDVGAPDFGGIMREHGAYVRALEEAGVAVEVLPALDAYPDSLFVEDTALTFTGAAMVLRPGAPTRAGEAREMLPALTRSFERVLHLGVGHVDGGDVLTTPRGVFVGQSARTTADGARALVGLLAEIGLRGFAVTTPSDVLHLKSDCSLLDDEAVLTTARLAATGMFDGFHLITVPDGEEGAANAVRVNDRVLVSESYPRTAALLTKAGYDVVALRTHEIAKIDAGLSCMSLRWSA